MICDILWFIHLSVVIEIKTKFRWTSRKICLMKQVSWRNVYCLHQSGRELWLVLVLVMVPQDLSILARSLSMWCAYVMQPIGSIEDWFRALSLKDSGVLYEDPYIQVSIALVSNERLASLVRDHNLLTSSLTWDLFVRLGSSLNGGRLKQKWCCSLGTSIQRHWLTSGFWYCQLLT
jgi:hypothetical protein